MNVQPSPRSLIATAFVATLFLVSPALAIDDTTRALIKNQRAVEQLSSLGDQLKAVLTPEIGFPQQNLESWYAAVDAAFSPELLEADVLQALETRLDEEARDAALAFDASPLGQETGELTSAMVGISEEAEAERLSAAKTYLETASVEQSGLFIDLFETQRGPRRASEVMDVYFRAMKIAAEPILGASAADEWMDGAGYLKDGYVEEYFLLTVSTFSQLPEERLQELVNAVKTPEMLSYAEQSTTAFIVALNSAADRLEVEYVQRLAEAE